MRVQRVFFGRQFVGSRSEVRLANRSLRPRRLSSPGAAIAQWLHGALDQEPKAIAALGGSGNFFAVQKRVVKFVPLKHSRA